MVMEIENIKKIVSKIEELDTMLKVNKRYLKYTEHTNFDDLYFESEIYNFYISEDKQDKAESISLRITKETLESMLKIEVAKIEQELKLLREELKNIVNN
jgi:hypothetical protein